MSRSMCRTWSWLTLAPAILGVLVVIGCEKDLVEADTTPPAGSTITNPVNQTALNSPVINVRGRAEVGATVRVNVNGVFAGSGVASPAAPDDPRFGRFTVEDVDLGEEGPKQLTAVVTDLYGNTSREPIVVNILLDTTAPPVELETIEGAIWDSTEGWWTSGLPLISLVGTTDTTATGEAVRSGDLEFTADSTRVVGPNAVRFWIGMTPPPLTPSDPNELVDYVLEAYDAAGNAEPEPFSVYWAAAGRETTLAWDDGDYGQFDNRISGGGGEQLAVRFHAPRWANFVTKVQYYIMNDNITNPTNPTAPSTAPFTVWIWKPGEAGQPGEKANAGYVPFDWYSYPENQWVETPPLPIPVNITSGASFPDRDFFAGIEWQARSNPWLGCDKDEPLDRRSQFFNLETWEEIMDSDVMIRAVVSDLPSAGGRGARTAVLTSRGTVVRTRR